MSIEALLETSVPRNHFSFVWFNDYAGVAIKTPTRVVVIDPVHVDPNAFTQVDVILITHEHFDHLDRTLVRKIHAKTGCFVVADQTSAGTLSRVIRANKLLDARPGESKVVKDLIINVEESYHPPAATPVSYVITTEDGLKIYHTSDSLNFPAMETIGQKRKPDVVFCTVGIAPGASPRTGAEIAKLVRAKLSIPYHGSEAEARDFARILDREAPDLRYLIIKKGEVYSYPP